MDRIWSHPDIRSEADFRSKMSTYKKVMLDPIWVSFVDAKAYDGLDPQELNALVSGFREELLRALVGRYPVVNHPGPGVLRLSIGLTGVESPNRILATTSTVLPVGIGISAVSKLISGEHTNVGGASMELAASDSVTGVSLFAAIDRHGGEKNLKNITDPLNGAKVAFKWWADRLRVTMDKIRG